MHCDVRRPLGRSLILTAMLATALAACNGAATRPVGSADTQRLFIIGQDLSAIRGYLASDCCARPDGATAYVGLYNVRSAEAGYGGLGIDPGGRPVGLEADWGAGPVSAWKTAAEFDLPWLAIGLSIAENQHPGALAELAAGDYDSEIRQLAVFAKQVDATILLRIGYEFDGFWNQGYQDPAGYVAAYRRVVDRLRAEGVSNVRYVWQGAASTTDDVLDGGRHDDLRQWYPGDEYVDWVGLSWFMHADEKPQVDLGFRVPTPRQLSDELLAIARQAGKPVLIAEAAPQGFDLRDRTSRHHSPIWDGEAGTGRIELSDAQIWDAWFQPMFDYMHANRDVIRGLAYINVRWDEQDMWNAPYESGYWGDSRVEVNPTIARRFNAAIDAWRSDLD